MTTSIKAKLRNGMTNEHIFVAKLLKYRILFKDILMFLGLDYKDASLVILYLIVLGISNPKIRSIG